MKKTLQQYDEIIEKCKNIFLKKMQDYGISWRILRLPSLTDQIYIKAQRIRNIEEKKIQMIDEGKENEFIGIINYSIMALIQYNISLNKKLSNKEILELYDNFVENAKKLMIKKNHDYGEAWRTMRISSFTDLILVKLLRIKEIENNEGKTIVSEGIDANYYDIINYCIFALIKLEEKK